MEIVNDDFKNGFNYCVERSIDIVNLILRGTYPLSTSPAELLLEIKEKILTMHYGNENSVVRQKTTNKEEA